MFGETLHLQHLKVLRLLLFYELDVELPWQLIDTTSDGYSNRTVLCYCSQHLGSNQSDESNKKISSFPAYSGWPYSQKPIHEEFV